MKKTGAEKAYWRRGYAACVLLAVVAWFCLAAPPADMGLGGNYAGQPTTQAALAQLIDRVAPTAQSTAIVSLAGETFAAEDFVADVRDSTLVTAAFVQPPDFAAPGEQTVAVALTDGGGNETIIESRLVVLQGNVLCQVEAGTKEVGLADFVAPGQAADVQLVTALTGFDLTQHGAAYAVDITINGRAVACTLAVADTIPPTAQAVQVEMWTVDEVEPLDFVRGVEDVTPVTAAYESEPDFSQPREVPVTIVLTDAGGNTTRISSRAEVTLDEEPPVITGAINKTVLLGENVSYRKGVTATDNRDGEVELEVDARAVDMNEAGRYPVTYSAVDATGNVASVTITLTVLPVDEEEVYEMADAILEKIITDDMTQEEKAKAIYNWVQAHVRYVSTGDKSGLLQGAYYAFKLGRGDCYTFYAASEVLLSRAGIETMGVERIAGASSRHYWNLVNLGDGWYHFDTCPTLIRHNGFMFTESNAQNHTRQVGRNYYDYDHSLYPEVVWE